MRTVTINENDSGQRVDKFLSKFLPNMPKSLLYKALRKKRVKRDRKALKEQDILSAGDVLELYINDEFFEDVPEPVQADSSDLSICFEDENILVADKPAGLSSHGGADSLLAKVQAYLIEKGDYNPREEHSFAPALSNRLDRNTRGLLLVAKNAAAQRELNDRIKTGQVTKEYICLVNGTMKKKRGDLCHYLLSSETENRVKVVTAETKGAKEARLLYEVIEERGDRSLVNITLLTGRKHQIRVQMASIGHPLVGDTKYGAPKDKTFSYQALCAYRLRFDFKAEGVLSYLDGKIIELSEKPF